MQIAQEPITTHDLPADASATLPIPTELDNPDPQSLPATSAPSTFFAEDPKVAELLQQVPVDADNNPIEQHPSDIGASAEVQDQPGISSVEVTIFGITHAHPCQPSTTNLPVVINMPMSADYS